MSNYTAIAATAKRLIEDKGRSVTLVEKSAVAATTSQPWRGPTKSARTSTTVTGVFLSATSDTALGEILMLIDAGLIQRGQKFLMVAATSVSAIDIKAQSTVEDGSQVWVIQEVATLQPGDTALLHALVLNK